MAIDYSKAPFSEQLRKVTRYVRLYGPWRTLEKVRAQRHMASAGEALTSRWNNPRPRSPQDANVALIGCGNYAYSTIAYYCAAARPGFLRGCFDPVGSRAISLCSRYGGCYAAADVHELLDDPKVTLVFIASNHASHAEFAIDALRAGKHVHIEKPHVVNSDQLERLTITMQQFPQQKVFLGFNRPRSAHFAKIRRWLARESGPSMINWFVAGHAIPEDHWYFAPEEGGRVLGNLCHWTDLTLDLVGAERAFPAQVMPGTRHTSSSNFALSFDFADGSVACITFSAKGNTFEGVREYLNVHRGNALVSMRDFQVSTLDRGPHKEIFRTLFRDHGHGANIVNSLQLGEAATVAAIIDSARLFLASRVASEDKESVSVPSRDSSMGST